MHRYTLLRIDYANALTLVGLCLSLLSLVFALEGRLVLAMSCVVGAGLADVFDGVLARRTERDEEFRRVGRALDTIVDMVSFGLSPPLLLWASGYRGGFQFALLLVFPVLAASRLAWFETRGLRSGGAHFDGVPVTYSSLVLGVFLLVDRLVEAGGLVVTSALWLLAFGFVANVSVPKPKGLGRVVLVILALSLVGVWWSPLGQLEGVL